MSCSKACSCQFNWPLDTQGFKRDPINSEKSWLDFAVRSLSREAVCKGRGQETVWNSVCRPSWWDSYVGLPWKNPTANPKDTKEALLQKYEALEHHLKLEGRFPVELEEEARLWAEGKYKELFLLTSLTSLLGKVTGVHAAVLDSSAKAEEMKAEINQSLLSDIKTCLSSTLSAIENIKPPTPKTTTKRSNVHLGKENSDASQEKCAKLDNSLKKLKPILPSLNAPNPLENSVSKNLPPRKTDNGNCQLKRLIPQNSTIFKKVKNPASQNSGKNSSSHLPLPTASVSFSVPFESTEKVSPVQAAQGQSQSSPIVIQVSQEELDKILQGKLFPIPQNCSIPISADLLSHIDLSKQNNVTANSPLSDPDPQSLTRPHETSPRASPSQTNETFCNSQIHQSDPVLGLLSSSISPPPSVSCLSSISPLKHSLNHRETTRNQISINNSNPALGSTPTLLTSTNENDSLVADCFSPFDALENLETSLGLENSPSTSISAGNYRTSSGRADSSHSHHSSTINSSHSQHSGTVTDAGYSSDEGPILDLDSMFSEEEQYQLWQEDGSFLLDRFLDDLDN